MKQSLPFPRPYHFLAPSLEVQEQNSPQAFPYSLLEIGKTLDSTFSWGYLLLPAPCQFWGQLLERLGPTLQQQM